MYPWLSSFEEVTFLDFEFGCRPGERPEPRCLVARELRSGRVHRIWFDAEGGAGAPPFPVDESSLVVAYYASAEMGCFGVLGWSPPVWLLDLYAEFRNLTNGKPTQCGDGLLGAMAYFGLQGIETVEKEEMRTLALRGGQYTETEKEALIKYCEEDVIALENLFTAMVHKIDLPRALLRGEFMKSVAAIEHLGIPFDIPAVKCLRVHWNVLLDALVRRVNAGVPVFEGTTFKRQKFETWLAKQGIAWPRLGSGQIDLSDDAFREFERSHPLISQIRATRQCLSQMRLIDLPVGGDSRNRCLLSPFRARTGRNQPSNSKFAFGPAVWLRSLIRPHEGESIAYIDYSQQEFGIAAALSGDEKMMMAYDSGDPYLTFAIQAGTVPPSATKATHPAEREQYKACVLAVQYGMGPQSLALRIGQTPAHARELLSAHHQTYDTFWSWSDAVVHHACLHGTLHTTFGWHVHLGENPNGRFLRNFPMQANGAEMLRLAINLAIRRGVRVIAPVHDAILIEAPSIEIDEAVRSAQEAMEEASRIVLNGFSLRSDAKVIRYPARYRDERGISMWRTVWEIIRDEALDPDSRTLAEGILHEEAA